MTIALSICSRGVSVILLFIQKGFIKYLLCVPFTIYFRDYLRQLFKWMCDDSDVDLALKDPVT